MRHTISMVLALLLAACSADANTLMEAPLPLTAAANASGCYVVDGTSFATGVFPQFAGVIDGDLEGITLTTFDPASLRITGHVVHIEGTRTVTVTGGAIPELVGRTLVASITNESIDDAADEPHINSTVRIESGAARGNLTEHGRLDQSVFPWEVTNTYRGVICP